MEQKKKEREGVRIHQYTSHTYLLPLLTSSDISVRSILVTEVIVKPAINAACVPILKE
jgi:hypothetical protein